MPEIDKNAATTKILWVDLEMTGLDPDKHVIIEVAAIVTGWDFKPLAKYEAIVWQPEARLEEMGEWAANQHAISGLTERVRSEGKAEKDVIREMCVFIRENFGNEPAVLGGNSIHNDRIFINKWWPEVNELLHYRMLDVSSWKLIMKGKYGVDFDKTDAHRAYDDIEASIAELQHYIELFKTGDLKDGPQNS
jgi:oligoribonuclease